MADRGLTNTFSPMHSSDEDVKGFVPTPPELADYMVEKLFENRVPSPEDRILYPGEGEGPFIAAVERYCTERGVSMPEGVAIELDAEKLDVARDRFKNGSVQLLEQDFLSPEFDLGMFDYVIGNPPYVPIEGLNEDEKSDYRRRFELATGRFDLYLLFFERALSLLRESGRLVFITPEKFEYTQTAAPLRDLLSAYYVREIDHVDEDSFSGYITFPTITTIDGTGGGETRVIARDGSEKSVTLPHDGSSWAGVIRGSDVNIETGVTLDEVTERVSPGVATGADNVFVMSRDQVPAGLAEWTYPTVSGKELSTHDGPYGDSVFVCPYQEDGRLPPESELGAFGDWVVEYRDRLEDRYCVEEGTPWYGWHENPPMTDLLQPKILCMDITDEPKFWLDRDGDVIPRHTVYYIIPKENEKIENILTYLNGAQVREWLEANCQRAANGFIRLQSRVLQDLPVPRDIGDTRQQTLTSEY
jgi:hypothetical protein